MVNSNKNDTGVKHSRVAKRKQAEQKALQPTAPAKAETAAAAPAPAEKAAPSKKRSRQKKKKKKRHVFLKILAFLVAMGLVCCIAGVVYVSKIIKNAPDIDTANISDRLAQTSTIYDGDGKVLEKIYGDKNRTLVTIDKVPDYVQNAFIALEDKTFRDHHGFNIIRIFGAIKDKLVYGGQISGTSTITQQLARNIYLEDTMSDHDYDRKIKEAYYAYLMEKDLSKDEILEGYLNTVNFGGVYGIQTAAKAYFNKSVKKLTIAEAAALASIPNLPTYYALVLQLPANDLGDYADKVIYTSGDYAYCWNDNVKDRMHLCLALMLEQGYITQKEYDKAMKVEIKDMVNPSRASKSKVSSYFADFVIESVISDVQEQFGYDYSRAQDLVYNGGLKIYTTLDTQAQSVLEAEFKEKSNFPYPAYYRQDASGNIITSAGKVMLYKYDNFIQNKRFTLNSDEFSINNKGNIVLYKDKRLKFYPTVVNGEDSVSVELPRMYYWKDGYFYSVDGAYVNIPEGYAKLTKKGNVIVSKKIFEKYPKVLRYDDNGNLYTKEYTKKSTLIQPQSAMTVIDNKTGAVVAMIGGRGAKGKMLYNRATATRQPGSSLKPIAVYSAALQKSFELAEAGKKYEYKDTGYDKQGDKLWGDYITAASMVIDERMTVNGKEWPKNSNFAYTGTQTFRTALQQSINTCAVKILAQVGVDYAYNHALKFGLTSLVGEGSVNDINLAALGIGGLTQGVSTLEMASAYTTFVNGGVHKSYYCYDKVTDHKGNTIMKPNKKEDEVLDPGVAWIMRDVLQTVVSQGIAGNARIAGEMVGGKTGTTGSQSENYDIWFDGFTANYTASLWIGADVNIAMSEQSPKAALLWSKIMSQINNAKGGTYSSRPSNVITATANKRTEYFTKGTEKNAGAGGSYTKVTICKDTGLLATPDCPHTSTMSGFQADKEKNEISGTLPTTYCYMHNYNTDKYPVSKKNKDKQEKYAKEHEEKKDESSSSDDDNKKNTDNKDNSGKDNSGKNNSGNDNSGKNNSGDNSGNNNSGDNSGNKDNTDNNKDNKDNNSGDNSGDNKESTEPADPIVPAEPVTPAEPVNPEDSSDSGSSDNQDSGSDSGSGNEG